VQVKRTIFYLDDDEGCLGLFKATFGDDYDVRTAANVAEARRQLAEQSAQIIISDQSMSEIKGTDFLNEVAGTHPASSRVLLTGSIHFGEVIPELGSGLVHFFVPKPWTKEEMQHVLERAVEHYEARQGAL
jgi:DNA-binding NtrC family response regulator